ncbi:MAG: HDOD domain-containing protein [Planctomycetes bacterium]|nr:HDOD domain-containing protein [Planctomycetota bacterium]
MPAFDRGLILRMDDLPTLPTVVTRILELALDEDTSVGEMAGVVESDQALSTKVLRIVNSAAYGIPTKITTIRRAITLLGFANLRNLVLSVSIYRSFIEGRADRGLDKNRFWQHSLAVAASSREIAKLLRQENPEEAYVCGLLHDMGRIVLDHVAGDAYEEVVRRAGESDADPIDLEREVLGIDHAEAGEVVGERWNLPPILREAIGGHHPARTAVLRPPSVMAGIVHVADFLAWTQSLGSLDARRPPVLDAGIGERLRFDRLDTARVLSAMDAEMARAAEALGLAAPDSQRFRRALQRANVELGRIYSLYDQAKRHLERQVLELSALNEAIRRTRRSLDSGEVVRDVLEAIHFGLGYDRVYLFLPEPGGARLRGKLVVDGTQMEIDAARLVVGVNPLRDPFHPSFSDAMQGTVPVLSLPDKGPEKELLEFLAVDAMGLVPLTVERRAIGLIGVDQAFKRVAIDKSRLESLMVLAHEAGLAIENARLYEKTRELAVTDELTQVANRRKMMGALSYEMERAARYRRPFSLVLLDIDHFKRFNDTFGHTAGDEILRDLGRILVGLSRNVDIVGRYGGEEVLIALPETPLDHATTYAERLRRAVEAYGIRVAERFPENAVTISIGVAALSPDEKAPEALIQKADLALYRAKGEGRNRVAVST